MTDFQYLQRAVIALSFAVIALNSPRTIYAVADLTAHAIDEHNYQVRREEALVPCGPETVTLMPSGNKSAYWVPTFYRHEPNERLCRRG